MLRLVSLVFAFVVVFAALPASANAQTDKDNKQHKVEREDDDNDDDEKLSPEDKQKVKLSLDEARTIATGRIRGKVIDEELEKEKGRLQYAFDIRDNKGTVWDVEIDAISGEVLQAVEDDDDDAAASSSKNKKPVKKNNAARTAKVVKTKTN